MKRFPALALLLVSLLLLGCISSKADNAISSFQKLSEYKSLQSEYPNPAVGAVFVNQLAISEITAQKKGDCRDQLPPKDYYEITASADGKQVLAYVDYRSSEVKCVIEQNLLASNAASKTPTPTTQATTAPAATQTPIPQATVALIITPLPTATLAPTATPTPAPTVTPYNAFVCSDGTPAGECSTTKPLFCAPANPPVLMRISGKCGA